MKNLQLIPLLFLLYNCSSKPEYTEVEPISTIVNSKTTDTYNETKNAYFGDLHIHSSWSFDAFVSNVRTSPDDAYRFGKGEAIDHVSGNPIQLQRPLDFMAVSDHAEYMGAMMQMLDENNPISQLPIAKKINNPDRKIVKRGMFGLRFSIATNWPYKELIKQDILQSTWKKIVESADRHYEPGRFTTFPAFEWTSTPAVYFSRPQYGQNLHRNVIFKGDNVSGLPFSSFDSQNPEDLWKWMDLQREKGIELLAIPHNGNISDGRMYALTTYEGKTMDVDYIQTRMKNEPVNEVAQIKGQSMTHPDLSPNDEFADFEIYQYTLGAGDPRKEGQVEGSFVRQALKNGLAVEQNLGVNPFQFGFIGSSDCHNGASNVEEDNNIGKSGIQDPTPEIRLSNTKKGPRNRQSSIAGLAGVWATENTREAIYDALLRKEVFATSGPRMKVRFFAGWDWDTLNFEQDKWELTAYQLGVPMGSNLETSQSGTGTPFFVIQALKDNEGANLDRVQVIKGWVDENGETYEKVFDVAWSGERQKDANSVLPLVGNTVDTLTATYTNNIGAVTLQTIWEDPEFNPNHKAFYYLRVLEIPTPRWTTYDAVRIRAPLPKEVPPFIQERAWSSPIWYHPN